MKTKITYQKLKVNFEKENKDLLDENFTLIQQNRLLKEKLNLRVNQLKYSYKSLEDAYNKIIKSNKKLEQLNKVLEQKVKDRTKQLEKNFDEMASSVHRNAVTGSIAGSAFHDLTTPLTAIQGSFELLKQQVTFSENKEILSIAENSLNQALRIIKSTKELMENRNQNSFFSPLEITQSVIQILNNKINLGEIFVMIDSNESKHIYGNSSIFERIIINILMNSIEELIDSKKTSKSILIKFNFQKRMLVLTIEDNGRGIEDKYLDKIFDKDFSMKSSTNLGFGLTFVKNSMEKYFKGKICVESRFGTFCKFILTFNTTVK